MEIIVVDDGSADDTRDVARSFKDSVRYYEQPNGGLSHARNQGLHLARGEYLQFLDADDVILPAKIEQQIKRLQESPGNGVAYCDYRYGGENDPFRPLPDRPISPQLNGGNPLHDLARRWETRLSIPPHCFLIDARLFSENHLRFDRDLPNHEDWDCWMRLLSLPVRLHFVPEAQAMYRKHGNSMSNNKPAMRHGFLKAIRKQQLLHQGDPALRWILARKRVNIDWTYRGIISNYWEDQPLWLRKTLRLLQRALLKLTA